MQFRVLRPGDVGASCMSYTAPRLVRDAKREVRPNCALHLLADVLDPAKGPREILHNNIDD
jgi:hypothetical protein